MVETLLRERINILFCLGGDGTQRGANALCQEISRRGLPISIVGIPKTIDNDLPYCDRTFGVVTAVEQAQKVLEVAHTEAKGAVRGIGLVRLMGRNAGFIACFATLASQDVNFALIPELPFSLEGEQGFLNALRQRMQARGHALIAVAEGAGQHLFDEAVRATDASGNPRLHDIGPFLKERIAEYFKTVGEPVEIKYIDPSYVIRGVAANCDDSLLCDQLARHAAHAAMSGRTNMLVCLKNGKFVHVPIPLVVAQKRQVDIEGDLWTAVLATTGQPARMG
jgi:6-phosphofructokinase 1